MYNACFCCPTSTETCLQIFVTPRNTKCDKSPFRDSQIDTCGRPRREPSVQGFSNCLQTQTCSPVRSVEQPTRTHYVTNQNTETGIEPSISESESVYKTFANSQNRLASRELSPILEPSYMSISSSSSIAVPTFPLTQSLRSIDAHFCATGDTVVPTVQWSGHRPQETTDRVLALKPWKECGV
jgi:hypothetical protein